MNVGTVSRLELWFTVQEFLVAEAECLDDQAFDRWLEMLADDLVYRAPVRSSRRRGTSEFSGEMFLFEETKASIRLRLRRLGTDVAWAEDPPSRTRRLVGNIRVGDEPRSGGHDEIAVRSDVLLYRNRLDDPTHDLLAATRRDVLRHDADRERFQLARREVLIDQSTLGTKNLGVFL